ncbi:uncharacterized protein si:dkey-283b1.6 [Melanotaenia boesemani]|uniref:uncharacterized protein si:dkey-283b1.6 n=1 Tax=Melanotaenia boesemani TaxID=1250792 RepID=UPI001C03BEDD|nr:uncharacterized protein si:dkey-283b1.6 [Melanotaenia boesemani]
MIKSAFPFLEIFLGILGFGLGIMFCTTFCKMCTRLREDQIEREAQMRLDRDSHLRSIYVIPFPRSRSQRDSEELSEDLNILPPFHNSVYYEPPPSYNELGIKPDDLPPPYTESSLPVYTSAPSPTHTEAVES